MKIQIQLNFFHFRVKMTMLSIFLSLIVNGQDRVTQIYEEASKANTFLTTYESNNYIVTITPDDVVNFYLLHLDDSRELIRTKNIPYAYLSRSALKLVNDKHFVLFSDVEILNYDFINDVIKKYPINNPLPPNYTFSVSYREQDGVAFGINSVQYIYYYKENRLETCENFIDEKFNDHGVFRKTNSDFQQFYYSNNYGKDKRDLVTIPASVYSGVSMYENFFFVTDSTGNIMKYYYDGDQDTLMNINKPVKKYVTINVHETASYFITFYSHNYDSTEVKVYQKDNLSLIKFYKLESNSDAYTGKVLQHGESLIFYTGRRNMYLCNPIQNKILKIRNFYFYYGHEFCILDNKLLLFMYENSKTIPRLIDLTTFQAQNLNTFSDIKLDYASQNQWIKNGNKYYYNLPFETSDAKQSMLFTISTQFNEIKNIVAEKYYAGIDRNHPLKKYGDQTYLLTNDLYKITGKSYDKVNDKALETLIHFSKEFYKIQDDGIVYAQSAANKKDIFFQSSNSNRKIISLDGSLFLQDILVSDDYAVAADIDRKLYLINIKEQTTELIDGDLDMIANIKYLLKDDKYFYYRRFDNLILLDPRTKNKKIIANDRLSNNNPMAVINGKTTFIFDDRISQLDENLNLVTLDKSFDYIYTPDFKKVNENLYYFIFRAETGYLLYKFDGQDFTKIFEMNGFINFASITEETLVFRVQDTLHSLPKSYIYTPANSKVYQPETKNKVLLSQLIPYNGLQLGIFQTFDSLYFVSYDQDYSSFTVINQHYAPYTVQAQILGTLPNDKIMISTGREFMYLDEKFKFHKLKDIIPNNLYKNIFLTDSIFYFMAIGNPYGNQVYAFNYQDFSRTFINNTREYNITSSNVLIYPNPTSGFITVKLNDLNQKYSSFDYSIFDIYGRKLKSDIGITEEPLDINNLLSGQYLIAITLGNEVYKFKFLILR